MFVLKESMLLRLILFPLCAVMLSACTPPPVEIIAPPVSPVVSTTEDLHFPLLWEVLWEDVPGWQDDDPRPALQAFLSSCSVLQKREIWQELCTDAGQVPIEDPIAVRNFFQQRFSPAQLRQTDGNSEGLLTGYYAPELAASRNRSARFRYPLYGVPDDLLVIDLRSVYPELGDYRLRGRVEGRRVVPYYDRQQIDADPSLLKGNELFWLEDPVELFFLQIQGSGRVLLPDGKRVMIGYADQNGYPYRSIGRLLLDRGEMTRDQMSMQNIKAWGKKNPDRIYKLLAENPSFVFFRELPGDIQNPYGALGVSLTAGRSLAVDPRIIPLGLPVFVSTQWPGSDAPLRRLMVAQDTGGAIKGRVRGDFYWGVGAQAGELAGRMKNPLELWLLVPQKKLPGIEMK